MWAVWRMRPSVAYPLIHPHKERAAGAAVLALLLRMTDSVTHAGGRRRSRGRVESGPCRSDGVQLTIMPWWRPLVRPSMFAHPHGESLDGRDGKWIDELRQNPRVRVDNGRF